MNRFFSTEVGTLSVGAKYITLTTDDEQIQIVKRIEVDDQLTEEKIARTIYEINGRFDP